MLESEHVVSGSCALAGRSSGRQRADRSSPSQILFPCRTLQAVSKWPADSSICLSNVSGSFLVSPRSAGWGRYYSPRKRVCFQISLCSADADWRDKSTNVSVRPLGHFLREEKAETQKTGLPSCQKGRMSFVFSVLLLTNWIALGDTFTTINGKC